MMFIKSFWKKKEKRVPKDEEGKGSALTDSTSISISSSSRNDLQVSKKGHAVSKKDLKKVPTKIIQNGGDSGRHESILVAERLMEAYNHFSSVEDYVSLFSSPEKKVISFEDDYPNISPRLCAEGVRDLHMSFPDVRFVYDKIRLGDETNEVVIEGLRAQGTHTGAPYTFAPEVFPAIPATGIHCVNDEEVIELKLKSGKIESMQVISLGCMTGPPGFYEQIGGSLVVKTP